MDTTIIEMIITAMIDPGIDSPTGEIGEYDLSVYVVPLRLLVCICQIDRSVLNCLNI